MIFGKAVVDNPDLVVDLEKGLHHRWVELGPGLFPDD